MTDQTDFKLKPDQAWLTAVNLLHQKENQCYLIITKPTGLIVSAGYAPLF